MTLIELETLQEATDDALEKFRGTKSNQEILDWLKINYPKILKENNDFVFDYGMRMYIRARRKGRPAAEEQRAAANLCFDFSLPQMELDTEISIPADLENPLGSEVAWKEPDDATLEEIRAHIILLRATAVFTLETADNWERIERAARIYQLPGEEAVLKVLRKRARASKG